MTNRVKSLPKCLVAEKRVFFGSIKKLKLITTEQDETADLHAFSTFKMIVYSLAKS